MPVNEKLLRIVLIGSKELPRICLVRVDTPICKLNQRRCAEQGSSPSCTSLLKHFFSVLAGNERQGGSITSHEREYVFAFWNITDVRRNKSMK